MHYPTFDELTKGKFNRYELSMATAKCARLVTDEYVKHREDAEKANTGNKETDKNLIKMINQEDRDEKAVKNAISRINTQQYKIIRKEDVIEEATEIKAENDLTV